MTTRGLRLEGAGVTLAGRAILSDITLDLTGARIGIAGRNGSGKTTLLRLLAGLIAPTTGHVRLGDADPARDRRAALAGLGILFQNPDHQIVFPTVAEEIAFGLQQQGRSKAAARRLVEAVLARAGRAHWGPAAVHTLSQGQRQAVCLMAVLAMEPRILLLDEPFAALDLPAQLRLRRQLDGLDQQVITISHDPAVLAAMDRVIWLEAGRVVADGPAAPVLAAFTDAMMRAGDSDADTDLAG